MVDQQPLRAGNYVGVNKSPERGAGNFLKGARISLCCASPRAPAVRNLTDTCTAISLAPAAMRHNTGNTGWTDGFAKTISRCVRNARYKIYL